MKHDSGPNLEHWKTMLRTGTYSIDELEKNVNVQKYREKIEPWIAALLQAEHLNLLIGSGLTTAIAHHSSAPQIDMSCDGLASEYHEDVLATATKSANIGGRKTPNIEDVIRTSLEFIQGLGVILEKQHDHDEFVKKAKELHESWSEALEGKLSSFLGQILETEAGVRSCIENDTAIAQKVRRLLCSFLLSFASRTSTRERLHVFTTNYDRVIEYGADLLGLRIISRFVGDLEPVFRASRLGVDMHYNPPGIRGEPRYLEGVIRLTKLHGSIDWRQIGGAEKVDRIVRTSLPFGAGPEHSQVPQKASDGLIIYPNPAKDVETRAYPYAELFRDFAAAVCQPNTVLVTYGYGFGDDHINRIIRDMLTIPSTHLAVLSFDDANGRLPTFCNHVGRDEQITLLVGPHFGDLETLVEHYLPKPAIDHTTWRMVDLLNRRTPRTSPDDPNEHHPEPGGGSE